MSSIVISETFKALWKSGAQRLVDAANEHLRECVLPPPASEQEPLPEELDDVILAINPLMASGHLNSCNIAAILAGQAASFGVQRGSLNPLYYMGGVNELVEGDTTILLQFPDRVGLPVIYTAPFPIRGDNIPRIRGLPESYLNHVIFMSYDTITMDIRRFSSAEERELCLTNGGLVASPYVASETGWCVHQLTSPMRYTGCYRLPTPAELDAYFASLPEGTVLKFSPYAPGDFFGAYGMRGRDISAATYIGDAAAPSPATARASNATNVPPQDFSGEPRPRPRRPSSVGRLVVPPAGSPARPTFAPSGSRTIRTSDGSGISFQTSANNIFADQIVAASEAGEDAEEVISTPPRIPLQTYANVLENPWVVNTRNPAPQPPASPAPPAH